MASVYLYIPNLIGYLRFLLLALAWLYFEHTAPFLVFYSSASALDFFDGYIARKLNQVSSFGAWLDVMADNVGRSMVWTQVSSWGWIVVCLEWSVFVSTHQLGSKWKEKFENAPFWVKAVMADGFHTLPGGFVIIGIHVLPVVLYYRIYPFSWFPPQPLLLWSAVTILAAGRCLCAFVEMWVLYTQVTLLVQEDCRREQSRPS